MAMNFGVFRFNPIQGEDTIANDGTSFAAPYFAEARRMLQGIASLSITPETLTYPSNYELDAVQEERETHFDAKEWILSAITISEYGTPRKALLLHLAHHDEGYLLDLTNGTVISRFYRGFQIQEFPGDEYQDGNLFLASIGVEEERYEVHVADSDFDDLEEDDEEAPVIEVSRPSFAPLSKKKIVNLGGSIKAIAETEEDDEEVEIEVERPAFEAHSKSKIRNLGFAGEKKRLNDSEDEGEEIHIEVERPVFTATNNKKPRNLNATPKKKKPAKEESSRHATNVEAPKIESISPQFSPLPKQGKPRNLDEKKVEKPSKIRLENVVSQPHFGGEKEKQKIEIERPAFAPNHNGKPINLHDRNENKTVVVEPIGFVAAKRREIASTPKEEEKNWVSFDALKLKPRVFQGERAIIHEKDNQSSESFFKDVYAQLKEVTSLRISKNCVFVPNLLQEDDPHILALKDFDIAHYDILALTLDREERPIYALLSDKTETNFVLQVSFKHKGPHLVVHSLKGASVDDRALPYYAYADLRKLCGLV